MYLYMQCEQRVKTFYIFQNFADMLTVKELSVARTRNTVELELMSDTVDIL